MKNGLITTILALLTHVISIAQTTLTITDATAGNSGSADVILALAETYANAGQTVTVNINTSGLCDVGNIYLAPTDGSILIQKDPLASGEQGFGIASYDGSTMGLLILSNENTNITLKKIKLHNYYIPLYMDGIKNLVIDSVKFIDCGSMIQIDYNNYFTNNVTKNILIQNCVYEDNINTNTGLPGIYRQNGIDYTEQKLIRILNNKFSSRIIIRIGTNASSDSLDIEIKNNYSNSLTNAWSAYIGDYDFYPSYNRILNNYGFSLIFENNIDVKELALFCPLNDWKVESNIFDYKIAPNGSGYINIVSYPQGTPTHTLNRPYKIGFLDTASPYCNNQTFFNGNNTFLYHNTYPAVYSVGNPALSPYIFGIINGNGYPGCGLIEFENLDIPAAIFINNNVSVRKCKIFSSLSSNLPIGSVSSISSTITSVNIGVTSLTLSFTYTGIATSNQNDLYVDVYKSNANGDLLDYIGEQYITSASITGSSSLSISTPTSVILNKTDRIAITLTGLHIAGSTTVVAMGTSKAFYSVPIAPIPCSDCISSFAPNPGKKYVVSAWVKEDGAAQSKTSYTYPSLRIRYPSVTDSSALFVASGSIIDGWQRIEGEFTIPALATDMSIKLNCSSGDCYFDDIRVFPFDGSMKSYVYDPATMRLSAELDERNYATLYEYDEEGKLVRVKKETEKGVMTIKENRNNTKK